MTYKKKVFAAVDAGNGGTNAIVRNGRRTQSVYFPSARAAATGARLGIEQEMVYDIVQWGGNTYVVGDEALDVPSGVESHVGKSRYGNEFHAHMVATALARCAVNFANVNLTLMVPPGMYADIKGDVQDYFEQHDDVEIAVGEYTHPRKWRYESVRVLPEGLAAALVLALDKNGKPIDTDTLDGDVLIIDGGMYTLDTVLLKQGNFNPEMMQHATNTRAGIKRQVLLPVLRSLKEDYADCAALEVEHVDRVLRAGFESDNWLLEVGRHVGAERIDTKPYFMHYFNLFAGYVANRIISDAYDDLTSIRYALLIGGWADMVQDKMIEFYGSKILTTTTIDGMSGVHPIDANVNGALRFALHEAARVKS